MNTETQHLKHFYCLSLRFNPLLDTVPELFKASTKDKKEAFTRSILRKNSSPFFSNIILLKTCQRIELYILSDKSTSEIIGAFSTLYQKYFYDSFETTLTIFSGKDSIVHLVRLASGLESFITGENEIYTQIKNLSEKYYEDGFAGETIHDIVTYSLAISKRAKILLTNNTPIQSYPELSYTFTKNKNFTPNHILITGDGLLSKSVGEFWIKNNTKVTFALRDCPLDVDLVINCDAKTDICTIQDMNHVLCIDFSIPPILEPSQQYPNYFSIQDFKDIIERNNTFFKASSRQADDYIQQEVAGTSFLYL
jgi:glutamyl-tRNA reductase